MSGALAIAVQLLVMVGVVVPIILLVRYQRQRRDAAWSDLARDRDLSFVPGGWFRPPHVVGHQEGLPVQVHSVTRGSGKHQQTYTVARSRIPGSLPDGLSLGREGFDTAIAKFFGGQDIPLDDPLVDKALRVRGTSEQEIRQALDGDVGHHLVRALGSHNRHSRVVDGEVVLEERGSKLRPDLDVLLDDAVALALALGESFARPWWSLAQRHDLELTEDGRSIVLQGRVQGLVVSVRADRDPDRPQTRIRVTLPRELPGQLELRLAKRDAGGRQGIGLGDPVLDGMVAATAREPAVGRRVVSAADPVDDLHGSLLGVLHGHPGSVVTSTEVILRADAVDPARIEEQVLLAVGLAGALGRAVERLQAASSPAEARAEADADARARAALAARQKG